MSEAPARRIDLSIEVAASDEALWTALTTGEGLSRWFPPFARVTDPGVGGKIWLSWGQAMEAESVIEEWEPNRHLRVTDSSGLVIDYFITKSGSGAIMRIVHSGFGTGEGWDDAYDGLEGGWAYFLYNLKHYLECHAGRVRRSISTRRKMLIPRAEAWPLLLSMLGVALDAAHSRPDAPYRGRIGERAVSGKIVLCRQAQGIAVTLRELNDALLFVELEPGAEWHCGVWLSVYGDDVNVDGLQNALDLMMDRVVSPSSAPHATR